MKGLYHHELTGKKVFLLLFLTLSVLELSFLTLEHFSLKNSFHK